MNLNIKLFYSLIILLILVPQIHLRNLQSNNEKIKDLILSGSAQIQSQDNYIINYSKQIQAKNNNDIILVIGIIKYQSLNNNKGFNLSIIEKTSNNFICRQTISSYKTKINIKYIAYSRSKLKQQAGVNSYQTKINRNNIIALYNQTIKTKFQSIEQTFNKMNIIKINYFLHGIQLNQINNFNNTKVFKITPKINKQDKQYTIQIVSKMVQSFDIQIYLFQMGAKMQSENTIRRYSLYSESIIKNMPLFQMKKSEQGNQILWQEKNKIQTMFCSNGQRYLLYGISNMDISYNYQIMPHKFQLIQVNGLGIGTGLMLQTVSRKHNQGELKQRIWIQYACITYNQVIQNRNNLSEDSEYITSTPLRVCPNEYDYHFVQILLGIGSGIVLFFIIFLGIFICSLKGVQYLLNDMGNRR